jgi:cobalt-zinc-cadmium efflux system protein
MNRSHHHHHHDHGEISYNRAFALGVALNLGFVVVEVYFGIVANSLALLTDAGHNLFDVLGLLLAWGAAALAARKPVGKRTYGYSRATILAGLASGLLLMAAVGAIAFEAIGRLLEPVEPAGRTIMVVAAIGVVINTFTALLFLRGKDNDLNIRGAFLHMAADALVSLGVVISGLLIWWLGWNRLDAVISLVIAAVIFFSTWGLLRDSANLAVDAVPEHINVATVRAWLLSQPGVADLHDLHIWAMSTTRTALTVHLVMHEVPGSDSFLHELAEHLAHEFEIHHATIQIEQGDSGSGCHQAVNCAP